MARIQSSKAWRFAQWIGVLLLVESGMSLGTISAWGDNSYYQLGNGTNVNSTVAVAANSIASINAGGNSVVIIAQATAAYPFLDHRAA